jgi:hypothetical protein
MSSKKNLEPRPITPVISRILMAEVYWTVLVGCYTQPKQADPFGKNGGISYDDSTVGRSVKLELPMYSFPNDYLVLEESQLSSSTPRPANLKKFVSTAATLLLRSGRYFPILPILRFIQLAISCMRFMRSTISPVEQAYSAAEFQRTRCPSQQRKAMS